MRYWTIFRAWFRERHYLAMTSLKHCSVAVDQDRGFFGVRSTDFCDLTTTL